MQRGISPNAKAKLIGYGPLAVGVMILGIIENGWVALSANAVSAAGGINALANDYGGIANLYLALGLTGLVLAIAPFTGFQYRNRSPPLMMIEYITIGLAAMFGITAITGLIEASAPFKIFEVAAQSAQGSTSGFPTQGLIENPFFFASWTFENGAIEDTVFLPFYSFLRDLGAGGRPNLVASNITTGAAFAILHYVKEIVIYGTSLPLPAVLFIISAFLVRIGLNLLMEFSRYATPSIFAHGIFDFLVTVLAGVQI